MPRIRTVKPEFWSHPVMCRQEDATRLMALALLNYADDHGYFYAEAAAVRSFARPFDDDSKISRAALECLSEIGYIEIRQHQEMGPVGRVVKFYDHQRVDKPNPSKIKDHFDKSIAKPGKRKGGTVSASVPGTFGDSSAREGKGKEQGKEGKGRERSPESPTSRDIAEIGPCPRHLEDPRQSARSLTAHAVRDDNVVATRHTRTKEMIFTTYRLHNDGADPPWDASEGKQLDSFLKSTPRWTDEQIAQCIANLYGSTGFAKGTRPREWLGRLPRYLSGPLDEFNREKGAREKENGEKGDREKGNQGKGSHGAGTSKAAERDARNREAIIHGSQSYGRGGDAVPDRPAVQHGNHAAAYGAVAGVVTGTDAKTGT